MAAGFERLRVVRKQAESDCIASFHLERPDGAGPWPARPGQYLTLRVPAPGGDLLRTYSLSGNTGAGAGPMRITVKRESSPPGVGSCWLHDRVQEGDEIDVAPPRGAFVLDEASPRPVLLLAGGVGLTPLVAMLHRLAASDRHALFVHACEDGGAHALAAEVAGLVAGSGGRLRSHVLYRAPTEADRALGRFDSEGLVDRALLQRLLPLDDYDVYLCGPTAFMVAVFRLLRGLGVARDRIAYEFFGSARSLEALAAAADRPAPAPRNAASQAPRALAGLVNLTDPDAWAAADDLRAPRRAAAPGGTALPGADEVRFARSGVTAAWGGAGSLLELAEASGLDPDFSCRSGICNTCRCGLVSGEVDYFDTPLEPPPPGMVLPCIARPRGPVVLDL